MIENRPKIKLEWSVSDWIAELVGLFLAIAFILYSLLMYRALPETIPIHFNTQGEVDAYGSKDSIYDLPIVASIIFASISLLNRFPHLFNYPIAISAENAKTQYQNATRLLRYLKLVIIMIFFMITWFTTRISLTEKQGLSIWFLPCITLTLILLCVDFIFVSNQKIKPNGR